ncbi:hypothetical protein C9374_001601 [Naegleria lovaniensis]|uniref:Protein kinase domain-containing protein n=1 Tax=Naegleria lovaniensis TaxID=51637 RepID=A0AA88GW90_NAELO|nr:uncharacterized protein C9374_001601 [Naegleria lovaniensis]KAG2387269.1 hypothetical protein C9374_001601 [Naegleria lovaniensis]
MHKRQRPHFQDLSSPFSFIKAIEDKELLSMDQKIGLIIDTLSQSFDKSNLPNISYPSWVKKDKTKTLLYSLNIIPSGSLEFLPKTEEMRRYQTRIMDLCTYYESNDIKKLMMELPEAVNLFQEYSRVWNETSILSLISALCQTKNVLACNGEIVITGTYNSLFNTLFKKKNLVPHGDKILDIRLAAEFPYFKVKCDSFMTDNIESVVYHIREDKDSDESDWESTSSDGYKVIVTMRGLLSENIRQFRMNKDQLQRYCKMTGMITNKKFIHCFVLEAKFDEHMNVSYHLFKYAFAVNLPDLIRLVMFLCLYIRDFIPESEIMSTSDYVEVEMSPFKDPQRIMEVASTVLSSKSQEVYKMIHGKPVMRMLDSKHSQLFVMKTTSVYKLTDSTENYIYETLLRTNYCQYLPRVLTFHHDAVELEHLREINTVTSWEESSVLALLSDVTCALRFLHEHNILHRDVKPTNIFLRDGEGEFFCFVLADFNLSCHFQRIQHQNKEVLLDLNSNKIINEKCGTKAFWAPEVENEENYNEKIDIYSLALTVLYLLNPSLFKTCLFTKDWLGMSTSLNISAGLQGLLSEMLAIQPSKRPPAHEIENRLSNLMSESNE